VTQRTLPELALREPLSQGATGAEPRSGLLVALLVVTMLAAMVPCITGPFIFDDVALIHGNSYVHGFEHWRGWFTGGLWDTNYDPGLARESRAFWRPLVLASYALDWSLGGGSPLVFHFTNLLVHALNAVLLLHLLRGWVGSAWASATGAMLFALHPVQTEPVAWIAGRTDSLCVLGLLLATLGIRWSVKRRASGAVLQAVGLLVAYGSKEAAVVMPVLAALELWSQEGGPLRKGNVVRVLLRASPYLAVSLAYWLLRRWVLSSDVPNGLSLGRQALFVLEAYGRYAALLVWPDDLTLGRAWMRVDDSGVVVNLAYAITGGVSLAALLLTAWLTRTRRPAICLGLLAYAAMLLPVSGIIWRATDVLVSPRFLYLPLLGLSLAVAGVLAATSQRLRVAQALCAVVLSCLAVRTFVRAGDYESEQAFWQREITHNVNYGAAQSYFLYHELNAGRPRAALELANRWFDGTRRAGVPEAQKAGLIMAIIAATLRVIPDIDGDSLARVQRFTHELALAKPAELLLPAHGLSLKVARNQPLLDTVHVHESRLWIISAEAAVRRADDEAAIAAAETAVETCPDCWNLLSNAALILARAHRLERALTLAERALELAPAGKIEDVVAIVRDAKRWEGLRGSAPAAVVEAGMQSALGSFGRAYQSARPAIENPPAEPASVLSLAELAFRAGDTRTARSLLLRVLPAADVERTLAELARSVNWIDQPRSPDEWIPPA
jgi:protein O-mannosyl-transferase